MSHSEASSKMSHSEVFAGLVFDVGVLSGSAQIAELIKLNGGVVMQNREGINYARSDASADSCCAASAKPILHYSWIRDCVSKGVLRAPHRGVDVSVPPGYGGTLLIAADRRGVFDDAPVNPPALPAVSSAATVPDGKRRRPYTSAEHETMIGWCV